MITSKVTVTSLGMSIIFLPTRLMLWHLLINYYQTYAIISPTLRFLASLSVITPSEVETNAIPKPFNTLGTSFALA